MALLRDNWEIGESPREIVGGEVRAVDDVWDRDAFTEAEYRALMIAVADGVPTTFPFALQVRGMSHGPSDK
ncbi:MAG: hypothetical protein K2Y33_14305 [Mycolicibacterium frederiksbergense]|nr:hypothetical protein [Mycolicibacterium frederiksbergense]